MATAKVPILVDLCQDGTNLPAGLDRVVSSGTPPTGAPKVSRLAFTFEGTASQFVDGCFRLPDDYASGGVVGFEWGAGPTTLEVQWVAGALVAVPSSTDLDTAVYAAFDEPAAVTVPGTSGQVQNTEITLTMTNAAAGRMVHLFLGREGGDADDDASGQAWIIIDSVYFEYTT